MDSRNAQVVPRKSTFYSINVTCNLSRRKRENVTKKKKDHPVFIYFDIEARQDTGNHVAYLVCAETDQNDVQFTFKGEIAYRNFSNGEHSQSARCGKSYCRST